MTNIPTFVNDRSELQEREAKAKAYSRECAKRKKSNRLNAVAFLLLGMFEITAFATIIAYYIFIG